MKQKTGLMMSEFFVFTYCLKIIQNILQLTPIDKIHITGTEMQNNAETLLNNPSMVSTHYPS